MNPPPHGQLVTTDFLVLRCVPTGYGATVVTGLSPDQGQLAFIIREGNAARRNMPPFDLFRLMRVGYFPEDKELQQCHEAECLQTFSGLTADYMRYQGACWLARLALLNSVPALPHSGFFAAMCVALRRLAEEQKTPVDAVSVGVCMAFLYEGGWLEGYTESPQTFRQCEILLDMAMGGPVPALTEENWRELLSWALALLEQAECRLP